MGGTETPICGLRMAEVKRKKSSVPQIFSRFSCGSLSMLILQQNKKRAGDMLYGFKLFERLAIFVLPCDESVCVTTVYHGRCCARTGKLRILSK